jgi:solute carrier family 35, member E3
VQITKIAVAPAVLVIEFVLFGRTASLRVVAAILLVCAGVGLSTLTDVSLGTTGRGLAVGAAAVAATAMYQVLRCCLPYSSNQYCNVLGFLN